MKGNRYSNVEVFLNRQIGMEPLVIDSWAKKKRKWRNRLVYSCPLLIIIFLSRLSNIFSQINSAERVLHNDEF